MSVRSRRLLLDKYFIISVVASITVLAYFRTFQYLPLLFIPVAVGMVRVLLPYLRSKLGTASIDLNLLYLLAHMYAVSTGRPSRKRLFQLNNVLGSYGEYESALSRIATLGVDWGYGSVRAIRLVARDVRNRIFREFLLRYSEVLRTGEDVVRFLNVELAAARRNYEGQYYRTLDLMRIILGMHTTVMSSAAFILTVMAVFMMFMGSDFAVYLLTLIGALSTVIIFTIITYMVVPKEWVTPNLKPKPKHVFKTYNLSLIVFLTTLPIVCYSIYVTSNTLELVVTIVGGLALIPGLVATRVESEIKKVESFYPIFIRSFGLTYSVLPNYVKTLASLLMSDFGPLMRHLRSAYARLSNGIDARVVWRYFVIGIWSDLILRSTNVLVDAVDVGGDLREVGIALSDLFTRLSGLRSMRERIARTFEATTYVLQMLVTAITISIINILEMFSKFMEALAVGIEATEFYGLIPFQLTPEVLGAIHDTTIVFLVVLVIINALTIKLAYGGLKETFWVQIALLSLMTASAAIAMKVLVRFIFGQTLFPELIPT